LEAEEHDAETYDDLDFYQHLLKDFIDRSTAGAGGNGLLVSNQVKKRKVVDRRASKGRKIRCVRPQRGSFLGCVLVPVLYFRHRGGLLLRTPVWAVMSPCITRLRHAVSMRPANVSLWHAVLVHHL
jgi:hypothetical protein